MSPLITSWDVKTRAKFYLEQTHSVLQLIGAQGVGADQLSELRGVVGGGPINK